MNYENQGRNWKSDVARLFYVKKHLGTEDLNKVYEFMENEYTSEDSQAILEKAWIDGEVYDAF